MGINTGGIGMGYCVLSDVGMFIILSFGQFTHLYIYIFVGQMLVMKLFYFFMIPSFLVYNIRVAVEPK